MQTELFSLYNWIKCSLDPAWEMSDCLKLKTFKNLLQHHSFHIFKGSENFFEVASISFYSKILIVKSEKREDRDGNLLMLLFKRENNLLILSSNRDDNLLMLMSGLTLPHLLLLLSPLSENK